MPGDDTVNAAGSSAPGAGETNASVGGAAPDALLALKVNGRDLSLDHGFPARVIVPALPGVHNTKWVATMTYRRA